MEKKYFEAPYLKVVEVKNDILTTSPDVNNQQGDRNQLAPGRLGWEEEDF